MIGTVISFVVLAWWPAIADTGFLDRSVTSGGETYRYQVYVPAEFTPARSWPVIVYFHGNGAHGTDALLPTTRGLADVVRRNRSLYPAVIVFPQAQPGTRWFHPKMEDLAMAALDRTLEEIHGDPARVYLTGHSMGASAVYRIAYRWPQRFAALIAVAGAVEGNPAGRWSVEEVQTDRRVHAFTAAPDPFAALASRIGTIPTWIFHGDADQTADVEQTRRLSAAFKKAGANARCTEFPGGDHSGVADMAFGNPDTVAWLLAQHR